MAFSDTKTSYEHRRGEAVLETSKGRLPIFVHVGYNENLNDSVELAAHAEQHGAYAVANGPFAGHAISPEAEKELLEVFNKNILVVQ